MKWRDIRFEKPTKKDADKDGNVFKLYKDNSIGVCHYLVQGGVAWMPLSEFPRFHPTPTPLDGYRYVTDNNEKPSQEAQYWDTILQRWGTRAYPGNPYDKSMTYIVPIKPVYRPYANAAEFSPNRSRWLTSKETKDHYAKAVAFNDENWYIGERPMTYEDMLEDFTFDDGLPCGIKVS